MKDIDFEWDERKASVNLKKHGVSFEEAKSVFYDENGLHMPDPDHSRDEDRFVLIGMSQQIRMVVVCHCYRKNDSIIRLISARKATKQERKSYERNL